MPSRVTQLLSLGGAPDDDLARRGRGPDRTRAAGARTRASRGWSRPRGSRWDRTPSEVRRQRTSSGEGATCASSTPAAPIVRQRSALLDGHRDDVDAAPRARLGRRLRVREDERHLEERRRLAREPDVTEPVGPVGRQVHSRAWCRARREGASRGRARRRRPRRQDEDPARVVAQPQLRLAAKHPLAGHAGDGRCSMVTPLAGRCAPSGASTTSRSGLRHVGRAAHDLLLRPAAIDRRPAAGRCATGAAAPTRRSRRRTPRRRARTSRSPPPRDRRRSGAPRSRRGRREAAGTARGASGPRPS